MQAYPVPEAMIQFCPNFCDNLTTIHAFCGAQEPNYVPALAAKVKSDRCCDAKACQCVCHFDCATFRSRMEDFKKQDFAECAVRKKRDALFKKAEEMCKVLLVRVFISLKGNMLRGLMVRNQCHCYASS